MTTSNKIIGAIAVLALLGVLWLGFTRSSSTPAAPPLGAISNTNAPTANTQVDGGALLPNPSVFDYLVTRTYLYFDKALGMGNGTSVPTQMQTIRSLLISGTSTPCEIQNPFTATSSLISFSMNQTLATGTAMTYAIGTSTTAFATTTTMMSPSVGSGAQATLTWDPGSNNAALSSGNWVVVGATNGSGAGSFASVFPTASGSCEATFITDN